MIHKFSQNTITLIFLTLLIFYLYAKFLLSSFSTIPETDEVVTITTFLDYRTILLKYIPNNHVLTSTLGMITSYLFGVNLILLRTISLIFLLLIFISINANFRNSNLVILILLVFSFDSFLIDYSFLFRGYIISSFLFVLIFFKLVEVDKNINFIKGILFLSSLLLIHNLSNAYLIIPILIVIFKKLIKNKELKYSLYFIIPTIIFFSISIFITGLYLNKELILSDNIYSLFNFKNIYNLIYKGTISIFFPQTGAVSIIGNLSELITIFENNLLLSFVIFLSLLKSIINVIRGPKIADYTVIFFFIIFFLINKVPPERIFLNFSFFLILYIFYDLKIKKILEKKIFVFLSLIIITFNFYNHNFFSKKIHLIEFNLIKKFKNINCDLKLKSYNEFDYHYFYYKYLNDCKKKPDIFKFYYFYKTRLY